MATSKPLSRYMPTPVPQAASRELRGWLDTELDGVSFALNNVIDYVQQQIDSPMMLMFGTADDVALDVTPVLVKNYEFAKDWGISELPDQALGTILIPRTGLYTGLSYIYGLQSSLDQAEEIHLLLDRNGVKNVAATFDVATKKTDDRVLNAALTGQFDEGDVLSLWMNATDDLGIMTIERSTFQMVRLDD